MRILFIVPTPRAGTLQYTHNLANALAERGHHVGLATSIDYEAKSLPKRYRPLEVFDGFRPRILRIIRFLRYVRSVRPDVIHFQGGQQPKANLILCRVLRFFSDAVFVLSPQDMRPFRMRKNDIWTVRQFFSRMHHIFYNAEQNRTVAVESFGADPARATVLPIPDLTAAMTDNLTPEPPDIPAGRKLVLCFGLIEPRKGIGTLLESFPDVLARVPSAYLAIVGKPLMDIAEYEEQIDCLGLAKDVRLVPRYISFEELAGYFERAALAVLPYEIGWNSGVLASAFGAGIPVVASRVGGLDEVVVEGENGLLVPPRDPLALAEAMTRILGDDGFRRALSTGARRTAEQNSWSEISRRTESVYERLIQENRD